MSKHWKPDGERPRVCEAKASARWPEGATVGLVVLGAACLGAVILLYKLGGPRDVFGS
jgi:hypothetical protein